MGEVVFRDYEDLKKAGWDDESIKEYNGIIKTYDYYLDAIETLAKNPSKGNIAQQLKFRKELELVELQLQYAGVDPKSLSKPLLKQLPKFSKSGDDSVAIKYRNSVKNRATAIRALCIMCQGSSLVGVRECPSVNCPLWLFRLGRDPLRGKVAFTSADFEEEEGGVTDTSEGDADA